MKTLKILVSSLALTFALPNISLAQSISGSPSISSYHAIGKCLDVRTSDNQILLFDCHGGWNQAFRFVTGNYGMISLGNNQCLTSGLVNGPLTAQTCTNAKNQKWGFQSNGTLRNELGLCADIEGGSRNGGTRVMGWGCQGSINQMWYPSVTSKSASLSLAKTSALVGQSGKTSFISSMGFSGGNIVASGGGNIVAGGAGNIVAGGAGNIVAGGAGNILQKNTIALLANDGGGIVAGGAGNLLPNNWNFFSGAGAGIVAGGAGN